MVELVAIEGGLVDVDDTVEDCLAAVKTLLKYSSVTTTVIVESGDLAVAH